MEQYLIAPASLDDYRILSALACETFTETFGYLYSAEDLALFLAKNHQPENYQTLLHDEAYQIWVAHDPLGIIVGYGVAGPCTLPVPKMPQSAGELLRLYVRADHQGRALGGRLMVKAMAWLETRFDHLYFSVYAENHDAQRFYKRYGFRNIHEYVYMVGNHGDREFIFERAPTVNQE